jgi:hypothetical protein
MGQKTTVELTEILEAAANSKNWNFSVTGVWGKATATTKGQQPTPGHLLLHERDGVVTGVSTTQGSIWSGTFTDGTLVADYVNEYGRKGRVSLTLSADGSTLTGEFWATDRYGGSGAYTAQRSLDVDRETVIAHLEERLRGAVVIR